MSQTGRITAWFPSRTVPLIAANLCRGLGLALVEVTPSVLIAGLGVTMVGASFGLLLSLYRSWITEFTPEESCRRVVSLGEALGRVGSTAAPVVIGVLVGITAPAVGFEPAVRWVNLAIGISGGMAGILCVLVAGQVSITSIALPTK